MANILINGMKSKVGGGKVIFDNYLDSISDNTGKDHYFVLTPDARAYQHRKRSHITVVDVPRWAHSNLATLPLYEIIFLKLIKRLAIDVILNFGDIIIPTDIPQIYNFDWPFAVYPESVVWNRLSRSEMFSYKIKLYFFKKYLGYATTVMAQTTAMKDRLEKQYFLKNVSLVPAAVSLSDHGIADQRFIFRDDFYKFVYPATYYPHKNIEILEDVAALLKQRNIPVQIIVTLDTGEHDGARMLLTRVRDKGLDDVLVNVGRLPSSRIPDLYEATDGLLMPTLLETFGLPYVEAMHHRKPILTSDMDFARSVCGEAASYFDPLDAVAIADSIEALVGNPAHANRLIGEGVRRLSEMWDWSRVFAEYQKLVSQARK